MNYFFFFLVMNFVLVACTKETPNPRLEKIKLQAVELQHQKTKLEEDIKKVPEEDAGRRAFLTQDLELLKSRILRLKEEARVLNGGVEIPLDPPAQGGGGH